MKAKYVGVVWNDGAHWVQWNDGVITSDSHDLVKVIERNANFLDENGGLDMRPVGFVKDILKNLAAFDVFMRDQFKHIFSVQGEIPPLKGLDDDEIEDEENIDY